MRTPVDGATVPIKYRRGAELQLEIGFNGQRTVVPRGERDRVTVRAIEVPDEVEGPIAYGEQLGRAEVLQDGERIAVVPLVASTALAGRRAGGAHQILVRPADRDHPRLRRADRYGAACTVDAGASGGPRRRRQAREEATAA